MGIIRAAVNAVHGSLADQWLETWHFCQLSAAVLLLLVSSAAK